MGILVGGGWRFDDFDSARCLQSGDHFAALDLLAHRLKERALAVDYCVEQGRQDKSLKRSLFEYLLAIYFNPKY